MKAKRTWSLVLALALVLSVLASCASGSTATGPADTPATSSGAGESTASEPAAEAPVGGEGELSGHLRIVSQQQVEVPEGPLQDEIVQEFLAANPGVSVEWIGVPANDSTKKLMAFAAANDMPDLFGGSYEFYPQAVEMDLITDLNEVLPADFLEKFYPFLVEKCTFEGKLVALPMFCMVSGMLYRADWLEEKGLEAPETWEDFIEVCQALTEDTDGDGQIDRWGFAMIGTRNQSGQFRYNYIQRSFGVEILAQDENGNWYTDIGTEQWKQVLQMFCDFDLKYGIAPPGVLETSYAEAANLIVAEKAGFLLTGSNAVGTITAQNPDLKGKLASCMIPFGTERIANPAITGWSMSKDTDQKEAGAALLQWMCEDENLLRWNAVTGHVPTTMNVADDPQLQSLEMKGFMEGMDYSYQVYQHAAMLEMQDILGEAYQSVLAGNATVDEAAQKAGARAQEVLASYES